MNITKRQWTFGYGGLLLGALIISLVFLFQSFIPYIYSDSFEEYNWGFEGIAIIAHYFFWVVLVPWIYHFLDWLTWQKTLKPVQNILRMLLGFVVAVFHSIVSYALFLGLYQLLVRPVDIVSAWDHIVLAILAGTVSSFLEMWLIIGMFVAYEYYRRYQDQIVSIANTEKELSNARLTAFRMQLQPHFLFNALNSVMFLIDINAQQAKDMLGELAILMRRLLKQDHQHTVTLDEELEFIRCYLDIESIRFSDRLAIDYKIDVELGSALVPNLILQPLVENAIKHGFSPSTKHCQIDVLAQQRGEQLVLRVTDNGKGCEDLSRVKTFPGVGLSNVRKRLEQMFEEEYYLKLFDNAPEGFGVELGIPLIKAESPS